MINLIKSLKKNYKTHTKYVNHLSINWIPDNKIFLNNILSIYITNSKYIIIFV